MSQFDELLGRNTPPNKGYFALCLPQRFSNIEGVAGKVTQF